MEQILYGGYYYSLSTSATTYNSLSGGFIWILNEKTRRQLISTDGVIKKLRVRLDLPPGVGTKYTFTLMLNGNPTALTLDIANTATSGSNMVNEITVTGDDYVTLRVTPTGTPTVRTATWSSVFEGDVARESLILGVTDYPLDKVDTLYGQVMCPFSWLSDVENDHRQVIPTSGTIKNFYVLLEKDPGTAPEAYRFTLRKNGVSQTLTVTITADGTTGNDLVNSFTVVADDVLTMMLEPLNEPTEVPFFGWGMTFVADIDGESIVMGGSQNGLDNATTEYNFLLVGERAFYDWDPIEARCYQLGQVCILKKLHMLLSAAPGIGNKYTFTLRAELTDTNVVAEVSGAATTGDSGALRDIVADDDYMTLKVVPDSTPDAADAYWGFVSYMPPPCPMELCLYVDAYAVGAGARDGWTKVGATPYIDVKSFPSDYIWTDADVEQTGDFSFADMTMGQPTTVEVALYCKRQVGSETITVNVWDGVGWNNVGNIVPDATWAWKTIDVSAILNTRTKASAAKMWLQHNV